MVHIFPVDSRHFLLNWAKHFPELYQRYFIDLDHHEGFEPLDSTLQRFQRLRLQLRCLSTRNGVVWPKSEILKHFNNEYRRTAWWLTPWVNLAYWLSINKWIYHAFNPLHWALDRILTKYFGIDYASRIGICLEKIP